MPGACGAALTCSSIPAGGPVSLVTRITAGRPRDARGRKRCRRRGPGEDDGLPFIARIAATVPVDLDCRGHAVRKHRGSPEELDVLLAAAAFEHTPAAGEPAVPEGAVGGPGTKALGFRMEDEGRLRAEGRKVGLGVRGGEGGDQAVRRILDLFAAEGAGHRWTGSAAGCSSAAGSGRATARIGAPSAPGILRGKRKTSTSDPASLARWTCSSPVRFSTMMQPFPARMAWAGKPPSAAAAVRSAGGAGIHAEGIQAYGAVAAVHDQLRRSSLEPRMLEVLLGSPRRGAAGVQQQDLRWIALIQGPRIPGGARRGDPCQLRGGDGAAAGHAPDVHDFGDAAEEGQRQFVQGCPAVAHMQGCVGVGARMGAQREREHVGAVGLHGQCRCDPDLGVSGVDRHSGAQRNAEIEPRHRWPTSSVSRSPGKPGAAASGVPAATVLPAASMTGGTGVSFEGIQRGPAAGNTPRGSGKIHSSPR